MNRWLATPGKRIELSAIDPGSTAGAPGDEETTDDATRALRDELTDLQDRLWAESKQSLLIVLQALDAGGKDGTVKHVFSGVNPQGIRVHSFKEPSEEELAHDFLWRVHAQVPRASEIVIFNRSHYESVLVERVFNLVPERTWRPRYEIIRGFEQGLANAGTRVIKFMLHISEEEQEKRFEARRNDPTKHWKYSAKDLETTAQWSQFMEAYEDAIEETSTDDAPWYVVPADHKWYRNWAVMKIVTETLAAMNPQYPA